MEFPSIFGDFCVSYKDVNREDELLCFSPIKVGMAIFAGYACLKLVQYGMLQYSAWTVNKIVYPQQLPAPMPVNAEENSLIDELTLLADKGDWGIFKGHNNDEYYNFIKTPEFDELIKKAIVINILNRKDQKNLMRRRPIENYSKTYVEQYVNNVLEEECKVLNYFKNDGLVFLYKRNLAESIVKAFESGGEFKWMPRNY